MFCNKKQLRSIRYLPKIRYAKKFVIKSSDAQINIDKLRNACITRHGLVNEELRKIVWPILLNIDAIYEKDHGYSKMSIYKPNMKTPYSNPLITCHERFASDNEWRSKVHGFYSSYRVHKKAQRVRLNSEGYRSFPEFLRDLQKVRQDDQVSPS